MSDKKVLLLFDVDGTLTKPRLKITEEMTEFCKNLRANPKVSCGIVGGSDLAKQQEQVSPTVEKEWDYMFPENGLVAYKNGELIGKTSIAEKLGEENLQELINFCLIYMANLKIPTKRGTFIEFRTGLINVCPVGRNCSQKEREEFNAFDQIHKVRETFVAVLEEKFKHLNCKFSIGGQISMDVFPQGWDKTYCLRYLEEFDEIHFFGDKTMKGGNDYEIFNSDRTIGHTTTSPTETRRLVNEVLATL